MQVNYITRTIYSQVIFSLRTNVLLIYTSDFMSTGYNQSFDGYTTLYIIFLCKYIIISHDYDNHWAVIVALRNLLTIRAVVQLFPSGRNAMKVETSFPQESANSETENDIEVCSYFMETMRERESLPCV